MYIALGQIENKYSSRVLWASFLLTMVVAGVMLLLISRSLFSFISPTSPLHKEMDSAERKREGQEQVILLATNNRPDHFFSSYGSYFFAPFRGSSAKQERAPFICQDCKEVESGIDPTVTLKKEEDKVWLIGEGKGRKLLTPFFKAKEDKLSQCYSWMEVEKSLAVWPKDLLFKQMSSLEGKQEESLKMWIGGECFFVRKGDAFVFEKSLVEEKDLPQKWKKQELGTATVDKPLLYIKETSPIVRIQLWTPEGFWKKEKEIPFFVAKSSFVDVQKLFSMAKIGSSKEVILFFGKKRRVIREKDWWLKSSQGWKKIKTNQEIEDLRMHRLQGDLLIIDSIKQDKNKVVVKGRALDPTRTIITPFQKEVPIQKKVGPKKRAAKSAEPLLPQTSLEETKKENPTFYSYPEIKRKRGKIDA